MFMCGVSLKHPVPTSFLCGEFLLHIPCCLYFYVGSFSYISRAAFIFIWWVSLTHLVLDSLGSFSYTSHAHFILMWGLCLTHPVLALFFIWGVSLTRPMLDLLFCGEFLLHIPCWLFLLLPNLGSLSDICSLHLYLRRLSYTSSAGFIFIWGVYLTHPMLA